MLVLACLAAPAPVAAPATFSVSTSRRTPISPYIYGVNFPDWNRLGRGYTLARLGGNRTTAYNWETNASNAGSDWRHQNDSLMGVTDEAGWAYRTFMESARSHGAAVLLTIPTAGYVAADKRGDGDVNQTPDYLNVRFHRSLARKPGKFAYPPDTTDKVVYQDEFAAWLWKVKSPSTPLWFSLDNEPDLWRHTHARICLEKPTYASIIANNIAFASAIKDAAPGAIVTGPANYGWQGFRRFQDAPDANNRDFLDVYLAAMRDAERKAGKRLLDVLDIHWYPEARGDDVRICDGPDKPGTPAARIQAQIARHDPGTKLAITEYNYGGGQVISGAIAQADVLGIFGRYGVYAACNWGIGPRDTAEIAGFRAFVDYDGKGSRFADQGLAVTGGSAAQNSCYAALDSKDPRRMTLVLINKAGAPSPMRVDLGRFRPASARAWRVAGPAPFASAPAAVTMEGSALTLTAPPLSVTTLETMRR